MQYKVDSTYASKELRCCSGSAGEGGVGIGALEHKGRGRVSLEEHQFGHYRELLAKSSWPSQDLCQWEAEDCRVLSALCLAYLVSNSYSVAQLCDLVLPPSWDCYEV